MADLILFNANAITMDPVRPFAQLIAIKGSKITGIAGNEALGTLKRKGTRMIDCAGRTLLPGFIDAHCHFHAFAESLVSLNLSPGENAGSIADIQKRIRDICKRLPAGSWIRGKSYDEFWVAEGRHPTRWDLDAAAPLHPVKLTHRSGHAHVLNSLALKLAGIDEETGDPPGGLIDREPNTGLPTGILYGMGAYLATKIPPLSESEMEQGTVLANKRLLSLGITSIQDASSANGPGHWKRFEKWKRSGFLQPRITMMAGIHAFSELDKDSFSSDLTPESLRLGGVKIIADEVTGSLHPPREELNEAVRCIHAAGRQAVIHAIEETVVEAAGNAIEYAIQRIPRQDHRHRIEHCSVCSPGLLKRLARLGAVIVTQPGFIYRNGDRYLQTVPGDQLEHLYPVKTIIESGLLAAAGSDFPLADPNPMIGVYAAITRRTERGAVLPQQRISVPDAIKMHTINAAAAGFEDGTKGSLTPGKLADIIMLTENPLAVDPDHIKDIRVAMSIIGGTLIPDSKFLIPD